MPVTPKVKVFDPANLIVTWGPVIFSGWAKDDIVAIAAASNDTEDEVGVDGEVVIVKTNDTRADVTCTMSQMSDTNAKISAIRNIGLRSPGMIGAIYPMTILDGNGNTVFESDNVWVKKAPDRTFGIKPNDVAWEFRVAHSERTDGGAPTIGI